MSGPVADHEFGSFDSEPQAYRDEDGRRYLVDRRLEIRFDSTEDYRGGRSETVLPREGLGALDVFVCTNLNAGATGILVIDDEVAAAGDGRYQVALPPGPHRIEVQGADASSSEFSIAAGERVRFTTGQGAVVRHRPGFHTRLWRVKEDADLFPRLARPAAVSASLGCLATLAGLVVLIVALVWAVVSGSKTAEIVAAIAMGVSAAGLVTGVAMGVSTVERLRRELEAARLGVLRRVPSEARSLTGDALAFPTLHDLKQSGLGSTGIALDLDLLLYRLGRHPDGSVAYSGSGEDLASARAGSIRLWIDDAEVPCGWGAWFYPVPSGTRQCRVAYVPAFEDEGRASAEFAVEVADVSTARVAVSAFRLAEPGRPLTLRAPQIAFHLDD